MVSGFQTFSVIYLLTGFVAFLLNCVLSGIYYHDPADGFNSDEAKVLVYFSVIGMVVVAFIAFMAIFKFEEYRNHMGKIKDHIIHTSVEKMKSLLKKKNITSSNYNPLFNPNIEDQISADIDD